MTKMLFYVAPHVTEGNPMMRLPMINYLVVPLVEALHYSKYRGAFDFYLHANRALSDAVDQPMIKKSEHFGADIILVIGDQPEVRTYYPDSLILNLEFSIFSRAPYPATVYFDPCGFPGNGSYIDTHSDPHVYADSPEPVALFNMRQIIQAQIRKTNPYQDFMTPYAEKYPHCRLLPLGGDPDVLYRRMVEVMEGTPADIGVIVSTHPDRNYLKHATMRHLMSKYPNLIWSMHFENVANQSAYLMQWAKELIIFENTSVLYQALIWGVPVLKNNTEKTNYSSSFLFWLLTRYAVHSDYYLDGNWLGKFFEKSLERKNDLDNFYDLIDEPEIIFKKVADDCHRFGPQLTTYGSWSRDKLQATLEAYDKILEKLKNDRTNRSNPKRKKRSR